MAVGQVVYTPWCDEQGKVIDDGTVTRLGEQTYRWTAADPSLRWLPQNAAGLRGRRSRTSRSRSPRWRCRARRRRACCARRRRPTSTRCRYFRVTSGDDRTACPWTSRAPATRAISATRSGCPPDRALDVWDALMRGGRPFDIKPAGHAGARRRARRGRAAADRRRLQQQQEGADRGAEVHAVRDGARPPGAARQGRRSSAARRWPRSSGAGLPRMSSGSRSTGPTSRRSTSGSACAPVAPAAASRVAGAGDARWAAGRPCDDDRVVADAEATDRAGDDRRAAFRRGHAAADRDHRRSRAPSCRRDGRQDAVLQPAAEDRTPAALSRVDCSPPGYTLRHRHCAVAAFRHLFLEIDRRMIPERYAPQTLCVDAHRVRC